MSQEGWRGTWVCIRSGENDADSSNNIASEALLTVAQLAVKNEWDIKMHIYSTFKKNIKTYNTD